jgi:hypothetical protein
MLKVLVRFALAAFVLNVAVKEANPITLKLALFSSDPSTPYRAAALNSEGNGPVEIVLYSSVLGTEVLRRSLPARHLTLGLALYPVAADDV